MTGTGRSTKRASQLIEFGLVEGTQETATSWVSCGNHRADRSIGLSSNEAVRVCRYLNRLDEYVAGAECPTTEEMLQVEAAMTFLGVGGRVERMLIGIDDPELDQVFAITSYSLPLLALPWELTKLSRGERARPDRRRPLARLVPREAGSVRNPERGSKLLTLFIGADPTSMPQLNFDEHLGIVRDLLEDSALAHRSHIDELPNPSLKTLGEKLQVFSPDILLFVGHGDADGTYVTKPDGSHEKLTARNLVAQFSDPRLKLVVLIACGGVQKRAPVDRSAHPGASEVAIRVTSMHRAAFELVSSGVGAVVLFPYELPMATSLIFLRAFFQSVLEHGHGLDDAMTCARLALFAQVGEEYPDWAMPILFTSQHTRSLILRPEDSHEPA